jgi:predicted AlkP superfamily phosphohydrolase/phosphomutase
MSRTLVVGWDGATWSIADALCEQGRLPTLASLRASGASGTLESVPNMNSAPAWSTIATGLNPGRHGIFYFDEPVPGTYRRRIVNARSRSGDSLWRIASREGKRVIVVNVPISYPAEEVNGFLVAGLDTPSKSLPGFTHPPDLAGRNPDLFRDYVIEPGAPSLMRKGRIEEARQQLMRSVEGWVSVTLRLMRDEEWDLAFVVLTSTDTAHHFFWSDQGRSTIERMYEIQDEATGRLVELARSHDPDVNVLVLADHGGGPNTRGPEFMRIWLEDQGLQVRMAPGAKERTLAAGFRLVNRTLTRGQKQALARRFKRLREHGEAASRLGDIDWARTSAYSDGRRDDVLVNVAGREPEGRVAQSEYDTFVKGLTQALADIRELDTGEPVVARALHRTEAYSGPYIERAPDIAIRWVPGRTFRGFVCSTARGGAKMREVASQPPFEPGGHEAEGLVVATGPDVGAGSIQGRLEDVTPTVLALLGLSIPAGLDGRPLPFVRGTPAHEAAVVSPAGAGAVDASTGYTPEEEEAVRQRLEDLGYL